MKKLYIVLYALMAVCFGANAQEVMKVQKTDGSVIEINVSDVSKVSFGTKTNFIYHNHECVDLGLPSGKLWATCNVGANSPEEAGDYFAWGETKPASSYTTTNCRTFDVSAADLYAKGIINSSSPYYACLTSSYDAASANWGGLWRMPTATERDELVENCTWVWTSLNKVNGYRVTGPNGNSIFLPVTGTKSTSLDYTDEGYYWTSQIASGSDGRDRWAHYISFDKDDNKKHTNYVGNRFWGRPVRAICINVGNISVTTGNYSNVTESGATLSGDIKGIDTNQTVGIIYSNTYSTPTNGYGTKKSTTSSGSYSVTLTGLSASTKYYYRAYAYIDGEYIYGDVKTFTTSAPKPTVTTGSASSITESSAKVSGTISGVSSSQTVGIIYSYTYSTPSDGYGTKKSTTSSGSFSVNLSGLNASTKYYYRAYAYINGEYIYGDVKTFTTSAPKPTYKVSTGSASSITESSATVSGTLSGASSSQTVGIVYSSIYSTPDYTDSRKSTTSSGSYSVTLTGLSASTKYYYRAYAYIDGEYIYGDVKTFTTEAKISTYSVGDFYPNSSNPEGVVFYVDGTGLHGKIVSLKSGSGQYDYRWPYDSYGHTSTQDGSNNYFPTSSDVGKFIRGLGSGWYCPAKGELQTLSQVYTTVNATLGSKGYDKLDGWSYWSSTEYDDSKMYVVVVGSSVFGNATNGSVAYHSKDTSNKVKAVKKF